MTPTALLEQLRVQGMSLTADGDHLRIRPAAKLTDDLRAEIRANKRELLAALAPGIRSPLTPRSTPVVRLRLLLEAKDGRRLEAILAVPAERYDGLRVLELFEQHRMAGTTRIVAVTNVGGIL